MNEKSCLGCKFLYLQDEGYSNYTVEETSTHCALDRNPNLPGVRPWDWNMDGKADNWPATNESRCDRYAPGEMLHLDVEGEDTVESQTGDPEVLAAHGCAPLKGGQQP